jgi:hypothetical protein
MKNFTYFESTEGGIEVYESIMVTSDLNFLNSWMNEECKQADKALVTWMETAQVGQMYSHRLGYLVRMADIKDVKPSKEPPEDFESYKIYLLRRLLDVGYDEYEAKVIVASSAKAARAIANMRTGDEGPIWKDASKVSCIGIKPTEPMVVLTAFKNG